ncbi:MAG: DUF4468 domain-containing protein [Bacteroidetes bacterium]|nr:MAG: DUF4468 domain-containing protein [Bacteroidota bacterium]REK04829.1 MAG: DUF4468 domain-containing protein [Bacteroidota bacterium]REK36301.1 MAG: DUF4468 domain-containing protein [Bacteroidota bacterium]REK51033.1 MAG: DUF4468 domain-containing protein [Bacteroidota bacterium]
MKNLFPAQLLFIVCLLFSAKLSAQNVPVDSITGLITYEGVVEVKGVPAAELYKRANEWFMEYYKNPAEVIRENDAQSNKITGKHRFRISNPPDKSGNKGEAGLVQYTLNVAARDGRFRFEISEFTWKQLSAYPCERWMKTTEPGYNPVYAEYLNQLDTQTREIIASLKNAMMQEKLQKDRDNW